MSGIFSGIFKQQLYLHNFALFNELRHLVLVFVDVFRWFKDL